MVVFALSCFGLLLWLWLSFGGPVPLRPESYRFKVKFPEAATLAQEADVRLAGVNVGKVKSKKLDRGGVRTEVTVELKSRFAPIPRNTRAMLRQKTLLGETYVQLSTGDKSSGMLRDGGTLPNPQVEPTVELDEIFNAFDKPTRTAFQEWLKELAVAIDEGRGEDLNDALGNLEGFAEDGAKLTKVLDQQELAVTRLIKNTGVVFGAINQREGALRQLIVNSANTFRATASRDRELAETFAIFPTFLDESRATLARLERFARTTRPLVRELRGPARDLAPTLRDLGDLAPDLRRLFRRLPSLIRASRDGLPALERVLRGAGPLLEAAHTFLPELNPVLSYFNFNQAVISTFFAAPAPALSGHEPLGDLIPRNHYLPFVSAIDSHSVERYERRPPHDRGNAYIAPNIRARFAPLGTFEVFGDCDHTGRGEVPEPQDDEGPGSQIAPPCFVQPPSLLTGEQFPRLSRGEAPLMRGPTRGSRAGTEPAVP